jgi:ABC-type transport system involved in multi-copper enzyme maturation permease subunit
MAESTRVETIGREDLSGVRSRVSWGAILAGATIAIASYLLLTLLGSAIGLSVYDSVDDDTLGWVAVTWAIVASALALFLGGWVTSLCTAGETKREAVMYGVITWGVVLALVLWLVANGVGAGMDAMMGVAQVAASAPDNDEWVAAARRAGVSDETIRQWQQSLQNAPAQANQAAEDPATREAVRDTAQKATWGALAGMVLSLVASVGGALVGAGPNFGIFRVAVVRASAPASGRYTPAH